MIWRKIYTAVLSGFHKLLPRTIHFNICKNCGNSIKSPMLFDGPSSGFQVQTVIDNIVFFFSSPSVYLS